MKKEHHRKGKRIHVIPLVVGVYAAFLGFGLMAIGFLEQQKGMAGMIGTIRLIVGFAMACLGLFGVWDGIRDLRGPGEKAGKALPSQYILTDVHGKRSSNVSMELLQAQLKLLAESGQNSAFCLQVFPQPVLPGLGKLLQVRCDQAASIRLVALFQTDKENYVARQKAAGLVEAEEILRLFMEGTMDFSGWEDVKMTVSHGEMPGHQRLVICGESWQDEHRFFSGRDLELAMEGLSDGTYRRVRLELGNVFFNALPGRNESSQIILQLVCMPGGRQRVFEKEVTVTQAKFSLVQIYNNGMPAELHGWRDITDCVK